mmetsp:Transcript_104927/g.306462  ORF Transcript_104927/g.306462 Transcript_104927/m.306462 type:complete len:212 (+) Transcript_104927:1140-1775(+)
MIAPKTTMLRPRFSTRTQRIRSERCIAFAMITTASKRRPSLKARTTRMRRVSFSKTSVLSPPPVSPGCLFGKVQATYVGRMAARSIRLGPERMNIQVRISFEGVDISSSEQAFLTSSSWLINSVLMTVAVTRRRRYSTVKRTTQTVSIHSNAGWASGSQRGQGCACISGSVEMIKLPAEARIASSTIIEHIRDTRLDWGSSRVRKMRSARL